MPLTRASAISAGSRNHALPGQAGPISVRDFARLQAWVRGIAGISLGDHKHALVMGRLAPRLRHFRLASYGEYFEIILGGRNPEEVQIALDLLTTNETQFFREPRHFDILRERVLARLAPGRMVRCWSAACSSGEEPYSIAMTLASLLGERPWEILASDLSHRVLERARTGHYAMTRARSIPREYLLKYCLKGIEAREGTFLIEPRIRTRVAFRQINLNADLPETGEFDVIFLRNVMIYFDLETKRRVVNRVLDRLRAGGYLFVGHAESLGGISDRIVPEAVSVYRKI